MTGSKRYGVPYMGSKNGIALEVVNTLPPGEVFVDLFAGGCAVTHAAMESGKYRRFLANDADWRGVTLFRDAAMGKYRDERRLVDREYFHANKATDAYVALCWSFGSNGRDYLWNAETEGAKLRACRMVMGDTWQERRAAYMDFVRYLQDRRAEIEERRARGAEQRDVQNLEGLQRLQSLQSLQRLQSLEGLRGVERLTVSVGDYRAVEIPSGAVVYCDPPYRGMAEYSCGEFDHEAFYEWLRTRKYPVWVSEYNMPSDFVRVWAREKRVLLSATDKSSKAVEALWVHERWADKIVKTELF